jgi:hypothetical protein
VTANRSPFVLARRLLLLTVLSVWSVGCGPKQRVVAPLGTANDVLAAAAARPVLDPVQARFNIKVQSKPLKLAFSTGGGLIIERPGHAYVAVLGPFGQPQLAANTDGEAVGVTITSEREYLLQENGSALLDEVTEGAVSLDDLLAVLLGAFPIDPEDVDKKEKVEDGVLLHLDTPGNTHTTVTVDGSDATLKHVEVTNASGTSLFSAEYEPYLAIESDDGFPPVLAPSEVTVQIPRYEMSIELRFKSWKPITETPDVFRVVAPNGYNVTTIVDAMKLASDGPQAGGLQTDAPADDVSHDTDEATEDTAPTP